MRDAAAAADGPECLWVQVCEGTWSCARWCGSLFTSSKDVCGKHITQSTTIHLTKVAMRWWMQLSLVSYHSPHWDSNEVVAACFTPSQGKRIQKSLTFQPQPPFLLSLKKKILELWRRLRCKRHRTSLWEDGDGRKPAWMCVLFSCWDGHGLGSLRRVFFGLWQSCRISSSTKLPLPELFLTWVSMRKKNCLTRRLH